MTLNSLLVYAISLVLGASLTFAYAPFSQWWLSLLVLPAWLSLTAKYSKRPLLSGWWFGLGFFGLGISWVHVSIATFGGVPLFVSIFLMLLLCGFLALYPALFSYCLHRFFSLRLWPLAAPFLWLVFEWIRAHFLTGFPWLSIGYSQADGPLSVFYPLIGEIGLSALMILFAASIAACVLIRNKYTLTSAFSITSIIALSCALLSAHSWVNPNGQVSNMALVQGNIEQSIRWRPEQDLPTMEKYLALTEKVWGADVIIWPEAAVPRIEIRATDYLEFIDERATESQSALITGVVDVEGLDKPAYNALLALGLDTDTENTVAYDYKHENRFAKHHLLPIGEFVPFSSILRPLAPIFNLPMSSFSRGDFVQANLKAKGLNIAPAICFEIAFPLQIAANITDSTDAIVTVSNDAWFGDSHGPHQHLEIARVRAMEFGLPLLRATNTGLTAAYKHDGSLLGILPQFEDGVLKVEIELTDGQTPYLKFGNMPFSLFSFCLFAIAWRYQRLEPIDLKRDKV